MKNYSIVLLVLTILFIVGIVLLGVYLPSNYQEVEIPYPTPGPTSVPTFGPTSVPTFGPTSAPTFGPNNPN